MTLSWIIHFCFLRKSCYMKCGEVLVIICGMMMPLFLRKHNLLAWMFTLITWVDCWCSCVVQVFRLVSLWFSLYTRQSVIQAMQSTVKEVSSAALVTHFTDKCYLIFFPLLVSAAVKWNSVCKLQWYMSHFFRFQVLLYFLWHLCLGLW